MVKTHLDAVAIGVLLLLCASWGVQNILIKLTIPDISPVMQSGLRSIGAFLILGSLALIQRQKLFEPDGTLWWGLAAGVLFSLEFLMVFWGLEYTNASRAVIFLYTAPFVVAIGSHFFVPSERLGRLQYFGLVCAFFGIVVAFGESFTFPTREMLIGDTMLIVGAIAWGATTLVVKAGPMAVISPRKTILYQLAVSALLLPIGSLVLGEPGIIRITTISALSMAYQTFWIASFTFLAWFWLMRRYSAPKMASFSFLTPLFGVVAAGIFLNEPLTPALLIAMGSVAVGIYLVNKPEAKRA